MRVVQDLGIPLTYESNRGYGVMKEGTIPPIMFSFKELAVIMMGLSFVRSQIDEEMVHDAENVAFKIRNAIPRSLQINMNRLESKTLVSPFIHNIDKRNLGGDWYLICTAFVEQKAIRFSYKDRHGYSSFRKIDPQVLIHFTDHWNVIGYCHHRKSLRNFILDRMEEVKLTDSDFITLTDYSINELLYGRSEKETEVTVRITQYKSFSFLSNLPGRIIKRKDLGDVLQLTFLIDNLDYINEWLLGFGHHLRILEPAELRNKRITLLKEMLESV